MTLVLLLLAVFGSTPISPPAVSSSGVMGKATWYDDGPGLYGAIDRKDSDFEKGDSVRVTSGGTSVVVQIVDTCGCPGDRIIDLSPAAFTRLAPLSQGIVPVTIAAAGPLPTLPATDMVP